MTAPQVSVLLIAISCAVAGGLIGVIVGGAMALAEAEENLKRQWKRGFDAGKAFARGDLVEAGELFNRRECKR